MLFKQIKLGPMRNFSYLIGDENTGEAAVVDPGWEIDRLLSIAGKEKLKITKIILTHSHYDHAQKAGELASKTKADVYIHQSEAEEIKKFGIQNAKFFSKDDGDSQIKIGAVKIRVIHTPGHTPGAVCLLFRNRLITGDTLFVNAIGRTDLPGGDSARLFNSLQKLKKLGDDVEVYPGHDYGEVPFSTIGREKKNNPYFR